MKSILLFACILVTKITFAQSCLGNWITIDDNTGKKKSVVELYKTDGELYGKIIYLYPREGRGPNPKCTLCTDDRKNKPLDGLQIVRGVEWNGSEWEDGTIVDPENGKTYTVKMWIDASKPDKLNVRGYIGPFYRTQTWTRTTKDF